MFIHNRRLQMVREQETEACLNSFALSSLSERHQNVTPRARTSGLLPHFSQFLLGICPVIIDNCELAQWKGVNFQTSSE